jgi:hypothetical protein
LTKGPAGPSGGHLGEKRGKANKKAGKAMPSRLFCLPIYRGRNDRGDTKGIGDHPVVFANGTLNAQSSGLATRSSGRPDRKIPNGLGSEFNPGAPQFVPRDEGAISSRPIIQPKSRRLSVR